MSRYAWTDSGQECRWFGDADQWGLCRENVNKVEDNGFSANYQRVNLCSGETQTGAWACIDMGTTWSNLANGHYRFTWGGGQKGFGQSIYNKIAARRLCRAHIRAQGRIATSKCPP